IEEIRWKQVRGGESIGHTVPIDLPAAAGERPGDVRVERPEKGSEILDGGTNIVRRRSGGLENDGSRRGERRCSEDEQGQGAKISFHGTLLSRTLGGRELFWKRKAVLSLAIETRPRMHRVPSRLGQLTTGIVHTHRGAPASERLRLNVLLHRRHPDPAPGRS